MQVKIILKSNFEANKIEVDTTKNNFFVNNIKKNINTFDFVEKLSKIILGWKNEYIGPQVIDGESFIIEINDGQFKKVITGFNAFPQNYNKLLNLISEVI